MQARCSRNFSLSVGVGEPTDALIYCQADNCFYIVGVDSHSIKKIDGTTLQVVATTNTAIYTVPLWASLFYDPTTGFVYTEIDQWDPGISALRPFPKIDRATMLPAGTWGNQFGRMCRMGRNPANNRIYFFAGSNIGCLEPSTDTVLFLQANMYFFTGRTPAGAVYFPASDTVWANCLWDGHPPFPWVGVIMAKAADLTWWFDAFMVAKYGVMPDYSAVELWPAWVSPLDPARYPTIGPFEYISSINRSVIGWEHRLAWLDMNIVDASLTYTGTYSADFGDFITDCIYHTDGLLYAHLYNGNVVSWDPLTDTIVHTWTGYQPGAGWSGWPAGNYPGSYSRMAFDGTGTHLYVSNYGLTRVF